MPTKRIKLDLIFIVSSIYLYYFMEWLFFLPGASFLYRLSLWKSLQVIIIAPFPLALAGLLAIIMLHLLSHLPLFRTPIRILLACSHFLPAALLALCMGLMFDNFLYNTWNHGVASLEQPWALICLIPLLVFFRFSVEVFSTLYRDDFIQKNSHYILCCGLVLMLSSLGLLTTRYLEYATNDHSIRTPIADHQNLKNIILLGGDGISADHMSIYGYRRETTPFLDQFVPKTMFIENAFPNGCMTPNSVPSKLTGKLPTETNVIYTPDFLIGKNARQHIPGLLKTLGYEVHDISIPYTADAYWLNFQNGFDTANFRRRGYFSSLLSDSMQDAFSYETYFLYRVYERAEERLLHILNIRDMPVWRLNTDNLKHGYLDERRVARVKEIIESSNKPFFIHVHLMETHGPLFYPKARKFSTGLKQSTIWMEDFYDDAILDFDKYVESIVATLEKSDKLKNTIIVINSDHGSQWSCRRTPLIIYFPTIKSGTRITANVQHLDLGPTILAYLKIPIPDWFKGQSLLSEPLNPLRPILFVSRVQEGGTTPPFYNLAALGAYICQNMYELDLATDNISSRPIEGHTATCPEDTLPSPQEVKVLFKQHLKEAGY